MDSTLHIDSEPDKGSRFWFDITLPAKRTVPEYESASSRKILGLRGLSHKILVVDDHDDNRLMLCRLLTSLGFTTAEAVNGQDGLAQYRTFHPDLILLDLKMPIINGYDVARQIREHETLLPIIAISAEAHEHTRQQSLDAGCNDFLVKPIHIDDLLQRIDRLLQIDWIYDIPAKEPEPPISLPPVETLNALLDAARIGDVMEIRTQLQALQQLQDPALQTFIYQLQQLNDTYRIDKLQQALEIYMAASVPESEPPQTLLAELSRALFTAPGEWRDRLRNAIEAAEFDTTLNLLEELRSGHSALADMLIPLVKTYRFDILETLLTKHSESSEKERKMSI
jgi:CheY-like chemotaxis protein